MGHACAVNCTTGAALIFLSFCLVPWTAFAGDTHDAVEKSIPQGPPASDDDAAYCAASRAQGRDYSPCVGDEGIYTKVPNPEAGHEKEVIPPPGSPGGDPNAARDRASGRGRLE